MKRMFPLLLGLFIFSSCVPVQNGGPGALVGQLPLPKGPKKLIAVSTFENKTNVAGQIHLGTGMTEQLTDALIKSGHFIVLERQDIKGVLEEQNFAASGRATAEGGAKIGELNRAQILIKGAITEFSKEESGGGQGFNYEGINIKMQSSKAHVGVIIYLYDTTTGQVLDSQRCEGKAEEGGLAFSYTEADFSFGSSGFKSTPLGKATQMAIDQAVYFIVKKMSALPWEGRVVTVKAGQVYINTGASGGILVGDEFEVFEEGEALVDPETGLRLGAEQTRIGRVQVVEVQDKYAKAISISGQGFQKNNIVKYVIPVVVPSVDSVQPPQTQVH